MKSILFFFLLKTALCFEWNYDTVGPDAWKANFPTTCGKGEEQSPINIITAATTYDKTLAPINFNNYSQTITWNITNNGRTIVGYKKNLDTVLSITGSNFGKKFYLIQFHFHWGYNDYQGSEHLIDYAKFPLEIHLVHQASDNTLAVVGFLFELSSTDNTALKPIINAAVDDKYESALVNFTLASLLPSQDSLLQKGYFRYTGSLTTPPCTEDIIWTVYKQKINISSSQLSAFRNYSVPSNFRDPQKLYSRRVYYSNSSCVFHLNFLMFIFMQIFSFKFAIYE